MGYAPDSAPCFSSADRFEQPRWGERFLQEGRSDWYRMLHDCAGHDDNVQMRVLAAGILSERRTGHLTREVVIGDERL